MRRWLATILVSISVLATAASRAGRAQDALKPRRADAVVHSTGRPRTMPLPRAGRITGRPDRGRRALEVPERHLRFVHGSDDRWRIGWTEIWPYRTVCKVIADFGADYVSVGSGVMVGPSHVLTAAHVVFDAESGGWADEVIVIPGYDDGDEPFGRTYASNLRAWAGYTDFDDDEWDMALVELSEPLGDYTGSLGLWAADDSDLKYEIVKSAGYPADLADRLGADHMWGALGTVLRLSENQLQYSHFFDSAEGQSGSGLWIDPAGSGDDYHVVGVHTFGIRRGLNGGARLTPYRFASVSAWIDGWDGPPELVAESVSSTLEVVAEPLTPAAATFVVRNDGEAPTDCLVAIYLAGTADGPVRLGSATVTLAAGARSSVPIPFVLPSGRGQRRARLDARVNDDDSVIEGDYDDNTVASAAFAALPQAESLALGATARRRMEHGEIARYRIDVPPGLARLRIRLTGARCSATIAGPGGEGGWTTGTRSFLAPTAGSWTILLENLGRRARPVSLRSLAR